MTMKPDEMQIRILALERKVIGLQAFKAGFESGFKMPVKQAIKILQEMVKKNKDIEKIETKRKAD